MSESTQCTQTGGDEGSNRLLHTVTDADKSERLPVTVVKSVGEVFGVDPCETPLHMNEYAKIDELYKLKDPSLDECDECVTVGFPYRDMRIVACSHGNVSIYGNLTNIPCQENNLQIEEE